MTVSSSTARADYNGNGSTTAFTVPFYFLNSSHLLVLSTVIATGVSTILILNSDYTVTGTGVPAGGTVITTIAPATGVKLSILRNVPITQTYHYVPNDPFPAASHENALDLLTMEVQQVNEVVTRAVKLPASSPATSDTLPVAEANKVIGWNATGDGFQNYGATDNTLLALQLVAPTGSSLVGHIASGTGAVARTVQSKLRDVVSVKDFGAVGDGVADDTASINNAYSALSSMGCLYFPSGVYKITSALLFNRNLKIAFKGDGASQSVINYAGANTTNDIVTFGDNISELTQITVEGIGFSSSTAMTGGAGVRFKLLTSSRLYDINFGHQEGNSNFYHGVWFDGVGNVALIGFNARASQDALRVNGASGSATVGPRADLFISNGKICNSLVGVHVGGAFGGLYIDATDIIVNLTNVLIDKTLNTFGANREIFFGAGTFLDSAGTSALPFSGTNLDIQDTAGFISFSSCWIASASTLINIGSSFTGTLRLDNGYLFNSFNTYGGAGHGIVLGNTATNLQVNNTRFSNIDGTAFVSNAGITTLSNIINPVFTADVANKYDANFRPLPIVSKGRTVSGGGDSVIAGSTDGSPVNTVYLGGYGSTSLMARFLADASPLWIELAKSRGTTPGAHALVLGNDFIGGLSFSASNGSAFETVAGIRVQVIGTPAVGAIASRMSFSSRNTTGAAVYQVWLLENGNFVPVSDNSISCGQSTNRWSSLWAANGVVQTSDRRTKENIAPASLGLDFINKLNPVSYNWISGGNNIIGTDENDMPITESVRGTRTHWGLIAQEVKQVVDEAGVDFGGWVLTDKDDAESQQALRYDQFISPLIKAVQELTERVKTLEAK